MQVSYSNSIYYSVRLTSRYLKAFIAQVLERLNAEISSDEVFTLDILKCNGSMCQRDLAKLLFRDRANTGKIAKSLENKGFIEIQADKKNNRMIKKLSLTEKGKVFLDELAEKSAPILDKITSQISEIEYKTLQNMLCKVRNNMSTIIEKQN